MLAGHVNAGSLIIFSHQEARIGRVICKLQVGLELWPEYILLGKARADVFWSHLLPPVMAGFSTTGEVFSVCLYQPIVHHSHSCIVLVICIWLNFVSN